MRVRNHASTLISTIAALLMLATPSLGQQADVRISPEPFIYPLPSEIQIQSAALIGTHGLAVWGTTVLDADSVAQNALVMQMIHDNSKGEQRILHSIDAVPHRMVTVVTVGSTFLVLWDDKRPSAPGVYAQRIDTNGVAVGGEERFFSMDHLDGESVTVLRGTGGYLMLFADGVGISLQQLDEGARRVGEIQRITTGTAFELVSESPLPNSWLIGRGSSSPVILYSDGTVEPRRVVGSHFQQQYVIRGDTLLAILKDSTIEEYSGLFDSVPNRTISFSLPPLKWESSRMLMRDSSGNYAIQFFTDQPFLINRVTFGPGDSVTLSTVDTARFYVTCINRIDEKPNVFVSKQCAHNTLLTITISYTCWHQGSGYGTFASDDYIREYDSYGRLIDYYGDPRPADCAVASRASVTRQVDSSKSLIVVDFDGDGKNRALLSAGLAPVRANLTQSSPAVTLRQEDIAIIWKQEALDYVTRARLMGSLQDSTEMDLKDVTYGASYSGRHVNGAKEITTRSAYSVFPSMSGGGITYFGYSAIISNQSDNSWEHEFTLYSLVDTGWRASKHMRDFYQPNTLTPLFVVRDPNANIIVASVESRKQFINFAIDSDGQEIWSEIATPPAPSIYPAIVPIGIREYLSVYSNRAHRTRNGVVDTSFYLQPIAVTDRNEYHRVLGPRFLRVSPNQSLDSGRLRDSIIRLELYTLQGKLLSDRRVHVPSADFTYNLIQNPKDSGMVLLWGSAHGVRLIGLDDSLRVLIADTIISETHDSIAVPTGIFRNDTLFCAWEDYRNGNVDIYATSWTFPEGLRQKQRETPSDSTTTGTKLVDGLSITDASPNPATERITITFNLVSAGEVTARLIDAMGREVRREARIVSGPGVTTWEFDLRDIHPGAYTLELQSGEAGATQRIIVLH